MAHHHTSAYQDVKNVPMIASPLFQVPKPIAPPYDMHPMPEDIMQRRYHDFTLEHRIVQEYQRILAEEAALAEAKAAAYRLYSEERQARLQQERITRARKIAPGFLDNEDRRILTPTLASAQPREQTLQQQQQQQQQESRSTKGRFDFSEFEGNGLPVADNTGDKRNSSESSSSSNSSNNNINTGNSHVGTGSSAINTGEDLSVDHQQRPTTDGFRVTTRTASVQDPLEANGAEGVEDEVIVQAMPLSELTGMLRDHCLDDDTSANTPRSWAERDIVSEKTSQTPFSVTRIDLREFEQGLGPPDPWDTPIDDMASLKEVMGHTSSQPSDIVNGRLQSQMQQQPTAQPFQYQQHPHPLQQQQLLPPQQLQLQNQSLKQQQQDTSLFQQPLDQQIHSQYGFNNGLNRTGYNSSPIPVASFVPPPKPTGITQQQQALQQHQQQHRHSTGAIAGNHPSTGLTSTQQQARFGSASPSPPPLPPPPNRAMTASPSVGSGVTPAPPVASRPPLPARPLRSTDNLADSSSMNASASTDHTMVIDRSMTPPRPPLPPPPPSSHATVGPAGPSTSISPSNPSGSVGGPPPLKPRPPKEHEVLLGILGPGKSASSTRETSELEDEGQQRQHLRPNQHQLQQQHQHDVAPAPNNANFLIEQLVHMGFTKEQSRSALEKYDYDLGKASNHLLDYGE